MDRHVSQDLTRGHEWEILDFTSQTPAEHAFRPLKRGVKGETLQNTQLGSLG